MQQDLTKPGFHTHLALTNCNFTTLHSIDMEFLRLLHLALYNNTLKFKTDCTFCHRVMKLWNWMSVEAWFCQIWSQINIEKANEPMN